MFRANTLLKSVLKSELICLTRQNSAFAKQKQHKFTEKMEAETQRATSNLSVKGWRMLQPDEQKGHFKESLSERLATGSHLEGILLSNRWGSFPRVSLEGQNSSWIRAFVYGFVELGLSVIDPKTAASWQRRSYNYRWLKSCFVQQNLNGVLLGQWVLVSKKPWMETPPLRPWFLRP